jgi:rubrerythrin
MKKSSDFLKEALNGEFNAIRRYTAYAEIAKEENYPNIARLFSALIEAEKVHLKNHGRTLGSDYTPIEENFESKSTLENLKSSLAGETAENEAMYPQFMAAIKKDKKSDMKEMAILSMTWAMKAEKVHAILLNMAITQLVNGNDLEFDKFWICTVCGNVIIQTTFTQICNICGHDAQFYKKLEE